MKSIQFFFYSSCPFFAYNFPRNLKTIKLSDKLCKTFGTSTNYKLSFFSVFTIFLFYSNIEAERRVWHQNVHITYYHLSLSHSVTKRERMIFT